MMARVRHFILQEEKLNQDQEARDDDHLVCVCIVFYWELSSTDGKYNRAILYFKSFFHQKGEKIANLIADNQPMFVAKTEVLAQ